MCQTQGVMEPEAILKYEIHSAEGQSAHNITLYLQMICNFIAFVFIFFSAFSIILLKSLCVCVKYDAGNILKWSVPQF